MTYLVHILTDFVIIMKFLENVGLDTFLSNTTSEDNQSFNEIIKESEIQFQKKVLKYTFLLLEKYCKYFLYFLECLAI